MSFHIFAISKKKKKKKSPYKTMLGIKLIKADLFSAKKK